MLPNASELISDGLTNLGLSDLFASVQATVPTLAILLAEFVSLDTAVAAIKAKLAQSGLVSGVE
jgi:hypothetical protein